MQRFQAFMFELMPTDEQRRDMCCYAGSCRFVYNKALALQKENYEAGGKFIGYVAMAKRLTEWRNDLETGWLKDAPVHALQHSLRNLEQAYKNFFAKRSAFPCFKKKGSRDSFRYPDRKQIKLDQVNSRIFLPKLGWVRYRNSRDVLGELRHVTVSLRAGRWFVSVQTECRVENPVPQATSAIGVDVGVTRFATFSDGTFVPPVNSFRRHEAQLRRAQQSLSRKTKYSNNWKKAKAKIQRLHFRIGNVRRDFLHKVTTTISQNHAMVCVEDLRVQNMSGSAAGSITRPGRNVRGKAGLNKSILDQGWFEFRRQLEYKLTWSGGWLVAVQPRNTSRTCPRCDYISRDSRVTQARFVCVDCRFEEHADVVGALNVLARGHRVAACGERVQLGRSVKQEPTEVAVRLIV